MGERSGMTPDDRLLDVDDLGVERERDIRPVSAKTLCKQREIVVAEGVRFFDVRHHDTVRVQLLALRAYGTPSWRACTQTAQSHSGRGVGIAPAVPRNSTLMLIV